MSEGFRVTLSRPMPAARNRLLEALLSARQEPVAKCDGNHRKPELAALASGPTKHLQLPISAPQSFHARLPVTLPAQKSAEFGHRAHRVPQGQGLILWPPRVLGGDHAFQHLDLGGRKGDARILIRIPPNLIGHPQEFPGDH